MPLHIKDDAATEAVRKLARLRNLSLTEAVRVACEEALERDDRGRPVAERLADVHAQVRAAARTGRKADKAFFDQEWGEEE
jgi:antitoxin VapB